MLSYLLSRRKPLTVGLLLGLTAAFTFTGHAHVVKMTWVTLGVITIIVTLHEGGHFIAGRLSGMRCSEFYAGFGPELFGVTKGNTRYGVRMLPIGGYVKIVGMTDVEDIGDVPESETYRASTYWKKFITIFAGPGVNIILAVMCYSILVFWAHQSLIQSTENLAQGTWESTTEVFKGLTQLPHSVTAISQNITTPQNVPVDSRPVSVVGMVNLGSQAAAAGPSSVWFLIGTFNLFLGIFNLVPFLPLDGGHILVATVESVTSKLRGRRFVIPGRIQGYASLSALAVLLTLSAASMYLDIAAPLGHIIG